MMKGWQAFIILSWLGSGSVAVGQDGAASNENASASGSSRDMVILTVDKAKLRADLKTWPENPSSAETLMSFKIAIGKEEGDKKKAGDNKTPEGIYFTQGIIDGSKLPAKYGPKAIPINFPNPLDQMMGKTGYGIWLHGVEQDQRIEAAKVTEGCVAFYNADIMTLTRWLRPNQAIVMIASNADDINRPDELKNLRELTEGWYTAWGQRQLDQYIGYYDEGFSFDNMDIKKFRTYKKQVFDGYKNMTVSMQDVRVFTHPHYAISIMNQDFNGDGRYVSRGRKVIYWKRNGENQWRITHETFENRRIEPLEFDRADIAQASQQSPSTKAFVKEAKPPVNL